MLWKKNQMGWTASQQAGNEAVEAIAIALGEVLPRTFVLNQKIDSCLRVHTVGVDWFDGKAVLTIYLTKSHDDDSWGAIDAELRQVLDRTWGVREIFFEIHYEKSSKNHSQEMPVATILRDQTRTCIAARDGLYEVEQRCICERCSFAISRRKRLVELSSSLSAEHRAFREIYGGPEHM